MLCRISTTSLILILTFSGCSHESVSTAPSTSSNSAADQPTALSAEEAPMATPSTTGDRVEFDSTARGPSPDSDAGVEPASGHGGPVDVRTSDTKIADRSIAKREAADWEAEGDFAEAPPAVAADEATVGPVPVRPERKRKPQSGLLTAGSFDDVENFSAFKTFLNDAMQNDSHRQLPAFNVGRQLVIQVTDAQGRPVGGADVLATPAGSQRDSAAVRLATGSDGRALLLTGIDVGGKDQVQITVQTAGGTPIRQTVQASQGVCTIQLPQANAQLPNQLDLALVIDATGSMGDELSYLKVEIDSIAQTVSRMFPNVDQRYALIVYRDNGDQYVSKTFDFTSSIDEFRATLAAQQADGGGDYPEAMHVAIEQARQLDWREGNTARVMFLVADAPPHDEHAAQTLTLAGDLRELGVRVYPVASSGVQLKAEFVMRASALITMGQYLFLTDHSGVGNPHAAPHVPEYAVEKLDRMLIRMVSQELAGKRLVPKEVLAIERGEWTPSAEPLQPNGQQQSCCPPVEPTHSVSMASFRWLVLAGMVLGAFFIDAFDGRRRPC